MQQSLELVRQLVRDFQEHESKYLDPAYQEQSVRQDFINKFFEALGWDVRHERQKNPYEQEVRIEENVKTGQSQRRADYAFFISPHFRDSDVKFFAEAKKPSKNLANADDYFQIIRYGWHKSRPIGVLTDFEEFHIIDSRHKPDIKTALGCKIKSFHYSEYADEKTFAEIFCLFGREAVAQGSIEKYAADLPKPKGRGTQTVLFKMAIQPVDEAFLGDLDGYRERLAKSFKKENQELGGETLTEAVQRTIDRLVFIRFLEDKLIEEERIKTFAGEKGAWKSFQKLCRTLAPKYNGLIFKDHSVIDGGKFRLDDDSDFSEICLELSGPQCPYHFDQIPIFILGSIYERFLGKIVHATDKRVRIEEKPEVRKAGGVYYTPEYIVRYIVDKTVGEMLRNPTLDPSPSRGGTEGGDGLTPAQISKMAFADIACGSGSFLIEIYSVLLDYHARWYAAHPSEAKSEDVYLRDGRVQLTIKKKKEILLNNIHGVDIDFQATEVTQLSLYLKLLEDVTMNDAYQFGMLHETILPDLKRNIVCGNSLIGTDILEGSLFGDVDTKHLKPMNFQDVFPEIMKRGGFDAIVGNPPYGADLSGNERAYLERTFLLGNTDTACLFMGKAKNIVRENGRIGYIVPKPFLFSSTWEKVRNLLIDDIEEIVDCGKVWKEVKLEQVIFFHAKDSASETYQSNVRIGSEIKRLSEIQKPLIEQFGFLLSGIPDEEIRVGKKIRSAGLCLNELGANQRGAMYQKEISSKGEFEVLGGKQINRYSVTTKSKGKIARKSVTDEKAFVKPNSILVQNIVAHVMNPRPRIIIIAVDSSVVHLERYIILDTVNQITIVPGLSSRFVLGVLNSSLISWYCYRFVFANAIRTMHFDNQTTEKIPLPDISLSNHTHKSLHDHIVQLVDKMLSAKQDLAIAKVDAEKTRLDMLCESLDRQIDEAVYKLYGLTDEEIRVVEGRQ